MTITATVSIDRTSLGLAPLVIGVDARFGLTDTGLGRPIVTTRYTYADQSPDVESSVLLQAVRDISALPLGILVRGTSVASLEGAISELEDALWQFSYVTTVTVGGVGKAWRCQPAVPQVVDGVTDYAKASQFLEVVSVTIPVDPTPGA